MKGGETMKKLLVIAIVLVVSFVLTASAFAIGSGKTVEFAGGKMGKVVFSGEVHAKAGLKCGACHPGLFKMKKGADAVTMKDINDGKFCGTCHKEGGKAFPAKECAKCHKK
jgi:c(7)-type cytochrome triheme protein